MGAAQHIGLRLEADAVTAIFHHRAGAGDGGLGGDGADADEHRHAILDRRHRRRRHLAQFVIGQRPVLAVVTGALVWVLKVSEKKSVPVSI